MLATLRKYPPSLEATTVGHLDNRQKNTQTTKPKPTRTTSSTTPVIPDHPQLATPKNQERSLQCYLTTTSPNHLVYSDQTGQLPQASSTGNNYLLVAYDHDSNFVFHCPIKTRKAKHLTKAIADVYDTLSRSGFKPKFHQLDNECPRELKEFFQQPHGVPTLASGQP